MCKMALLWHNEVVIKQFHGGGVTSDYGIAINYDDKFSDIQLFGGSTICFLNFFDIYRKQRE